MAIPKTPAIQTENLTKTFGQLTAVNQVNLKVYPGEIYALIGPNGAGKTTLIKMLVGLLSPASGTTRIFNYDIGKEPVEAKTTFGFIADDPTAYDYLSGREFLYFTGRLRNLSPTQIEPGIDKLSAVFPLDQQLDDPISAYSRGNKQKLAYLAAVLAHPQLLIIDEPIVGLDPVSIDIFGRELTKFARIGGTVFFSTHTLPFAQKYSHIVGFMRQGKIVTEKKINPRLDLNKLYQQIFV